MNPLGTPAYLPGIDVSHFQGVIDWQRVKAAGIGFAFIKATDGTGFVDPQLNYNALACQALSIPFGLYHFFRPTADSASQAQFFLANTKPYTPLLPPALDLELGPVTTSQAATWLDIVDVALGRESLVYTAPAFAAENFNGENSGLISVYPLWIAEYTTKPAPIVPAAWEDWEFWQHTPSGQVDGVPNAVDLDWFHGTADDLRAWVK